MAGYSLIKGSAGFQALDDSSGLKSYLRTSRQIEIELIGLWCVCR